MKEILAPLKEYSEYQQTFDNSVEKTFEELVQKSHIDVELNRATVKKYNEADLFKYSRRYSNCNWCFNDLWRTKSWQFLTCWNFNYFNWTSSYGSIYIDYNFGA